MIGGGVRDVYLPRTGLALIPSAIAKSWFFCSLPLRRTTTFYRYLRRLRTEFRGVLRVPHGRASRKYRHGRGRPGAECGLGDSAAVFAHLDVVTLLPLVVILTGTAGRWARRPGCDFEANRPQPCRLADPERVRDRRFSPLRRAPSPNPGLTCCVSGPMAVSAFVQRGSAGTDAGPPGWLIATAQLVIGWGSACGLEGLSAARCSADPCLRALSTAAMLTLGITLCSSSRLSPETETPVSPVFARVAIEDGAHRPLASRPIRCSDHAPCLADHRQRSLCSEHTLSKFPLIARGRYMRPRDP
jgi:hypothetical protein